MPRAKAEGGGQRRRPAAGAASGAATVTVNRAPVLTLWAAVVAEQLGYDRDAAVTLGRAVAGLNAQAKGQRLGIFQPAEPGAKKPARRAVPELEVELLGRIIPAVRTHHGLRAAEDGKPASAESVHRYLTSRFGEALEPARKAMTALAKSFPKDELAQRAYALYERFRPEVPQGQGGWGAKGVLDLKLVRSLAAKKRARG